MRVVFFCFFVLINISFFAHEEDSILVRSTLAPTFRMGFLLQGTTGPDFYKDIMTMGSHGIQNPEYHGMHEGKLDYVNPYISVGVTRKSSAWYGVYGGVSFLTTKNQFNYTYTEYLNFSPDNMHYQEKIASGEGLVLNRVFRIEVVPTFYIHHTKVMIGFTNLDVVFARLDVKPLATTYNVTGHLNTYGTPSDSVKKLAGIQAEPMIERRHTSVHFPLTVGVEQEIPVKKGNILVGARAMYSNFGAYYGFIFYTGYRFNRPKSKY